jgi:nucleoside 2-deoxyribosyltransferase
MTGRDMTGRDKLAGAQKVCRNPKALADTVRRFGLTAYLAGPAVFLPCAAEEGEDLREIASRYGFSARFPLDPPVGPNGRRGPRFRTVAAAVTYGDAEADRIKTSCLSHMNASDFLIADITPFRGVGADAGTAFEMGYMSALGKPVFAWSQAADTSYAERVPDHRSGSAVDSRTGGAFDGNGLLIDNLGLTDNVHLVRAPADAAVHPCFEDACYGAAEWFAGAPLVA